MNGLEENKFDQILRSKLEGSVLEPPRDLLPNIMQKMNNGGISSGSNRWIGGVLIGFVLLSFVGYFMYTSLDENELLDKKESHNQSIVNRIETEGKVISGNDESTAKLDEATNKSIQESKSSNETVDAVGVDNFAEGEQIDERNLKKVSVSSESVAAVSKSEIIDVDNVQAQKNSNVNANYVKVTEKSVVAKVLAKKIDRPIKEAVVSEEGTTEKATVHNSSEENSTLELEKAISVKSVNNDEVANQMLETLEIVGIEQSSSNNQEQSIRSSDSNDDMTLNNLVNETNESINNIDVDFEGSVELDEVPGEINDNQEPESKETKSSMGNSEGENDQIILNTLHTDDVEQSKSDFVDSLQTAIQSQVLLDTNLIDDINTLELKERKWTIDILAGPSMSYRIFNSEGNQELQEHKNSYESSLMTAAYNMELSRVIAKKWKVHIGAMYLRTGEKYAFSDGTNSHETINQYDYLSIPLGIDFSMFKLGRFEFVTGVGAQYNFMQKGGSSWLDPNDFSAQIYAHDDNVKAFKEQVLAWNAELGFRYRLIDRFDIIVKEQGILFNNIYKSKMGMDQREYSFETLFGLGYRF